MMQKGKDNCIYFTERYPRNRKLMGLGQETEVNTTLVSRLCFYYNTGFYFFN